MKKIARVLVSITCLVLLTVFTIGCADKIDKKTLRHEQERMVEYTLQNFEDVKKIEFKSVEQNLSSRGWAIHAVINDDINIEYIECTLSKLTDEKVLSKLSDEEFTKLEDECIKEKNKKI